MIALFEYYCVCLLFGFGFFCSSLWLLLLPPRALPHSPRFPTQGKKTSKWLANYVCVEGGDSGDRGPCHKKYKKGVLPAKLLKAVQGEDLVEADEKELAAEKQMGEMKKMPGMPEEAMQLYTRDDVEDLAVYEMMKEGMDEDEARKMYKELKESGYLDNPDAHLHHANEGGEAEEEEANGSPGGDDL